MTTFKFNWHESKGTFYDWMLVRLVAEHIGSENFEKFADLTDQFRNVELGITINGEAVSAKAFIDSLQEVIEHEAKAVAKDTLTELKQESLNDIQDQVDRLQTLLSAEVDRVADDLGIELSSWD